MPRKKKISLRDLPMWPVFPTSLQEEDCAGKHPAWAHIDCSFALSFLEVSSRNFPSTHSMTWPGDRESDSVTGNAVILCARVVRCQVQNLQKHLGFTHAHNKEELHGHCSCCMPCMTCHLMRVITNQFWRVWEISEHVQNSLLQICYRTTCGSCG